MHDNKNDIKHFKEYSENKKMHVTHTFMQKLA